jgi:hypothetical protein
MTLVVRDEAEIVADQLDYHLAAGVDFVIATDHRSEDGTREILEGYERRGVLRLLREDGEFVEQGTWQTRMARMAVREHDADWVITSDADEFWFPVAGSLRDTFASIPGEYGVVRASMLNFVPLRDDAGQFHERMVFRIALSASLNDPATPYRPVVKVAHRADPNAVLSGGGAHNLSGVRGALLDAWHPLHLLHFPIRSREQCVRKYRKTWTGWESNLRADLQRARAGADEGRDDRVWERVALDPGEVARGLAEGVLVVDTRLRDALATIRMPGRAPAGDVGAVPLRTRPTPLPTAVFREAELVRCARRLDELDARLARLEAPVERASKRRFRASRR